MCCAFFCTTTITDAATPYPPLARAMLVFVPALFTFRLSIDSYGRVRFTFYVVGSQSISGLIVSRFSMLPWCFAQLCSIAVAAQVVCAVSSYLQAIRPCQSWCAHGCVRLLFFPVSQCHTRFAGDVSYPHARYRLLPSYAALLLCTVLSNRALPFGLRWWWCVLTRQRNDARCSPLPDRTRYRLLPSYAALLLCTVALSQSSQPGCFYVTRGRMILLH